jgi:hypothetical protein
MTELELARAAAVLTAVERLVDTMRAAGERHPPAVIRLALQLVDLKGVVELPLLHPLEDPRAVRWAPEVRELLVTYDLGDAALVQRAVGRALNIVELFDDAHV